ncbi:MAG: cytidine deaminase [Planctomycetes bacterium]|nr:cytidine deaminase [Planctomycetota bacterium]NBY03268.1 cytidine deaminase [Planctomycetota bacterium]
MKPPQDLLSEAIKARKHAYAPYSGFKVGAALRGSVGGIFSGCNVENASFGLTICAERTTVCTAVAAGIRTFTQMLIVADSDTPCPPCGACRQFLFEFAPNLELWVANLSGETKFYRLCDLLPEAFGPDFIPMPAPKKPS